MKRKSYSNDYHSISLSVKMCCYLQIVMDFPLWSAETRYHTTCPAGDRHRTHHNNSNNNHNSLVQWISWCSPKCLLQPMALLAKLPRPSSALLCESGFSLARRPSAFNSHAYTRLSNSAVITLPMGFHWWLYSSIIIVWWIWRLLAGTAGITTFHISRDALLE